MNRQRLIVFDTIRETLGDGAQTPQDAAGRDETMFRVFVGMDDMEDAQSVAGKCEGEQ